MARASKVESMARGFARKVLKLAEKEGIDTAEFEEETFLLWTVFGVMTDEFLDSVKREAVDFDKLYGDMDVQDWHFAVIEIIEKEIEKLCGRA